MPATLLIVGGLALGAWLWSRKPRRGLAPVVLGEDPSITVGRIEALERGAARGDASLPFTELGQAMGKPVPADLISEKEAYIAWARQQTAKIDPADPRYAEKLRYAGKAPPLQTPPAAYAPDPADPRAADKAAAARAGGPDPTDPAYDEKMAYLRRKQGAA